MREVSVTSAHQSGILYSFMQFCARLLTSVRCFGRGSVNDYIFLLVRYILPGYFPANTGAGSMRRILLKDKRHRIKFSGFEFSLIALRFLLKEKKLPRRFKVNIWTKLLANHKPHKLPIRNVCLLSSRSRSIFRRFGLSRIQMRERARGARLSGVKKI